MRESRKRRRRLLERDDEEDEDDEDRLQLPIVYSIVSNYFAHLFDYTQISYFALVVGYCAIGSLLFNAWEKGAVW